MKLEITNPTLAKLLEQEQLWKCSVAFFLCLGTIALWLKRKYKVNCWFCGKDSYVSKLKVSWWHCTFCEQFNGFQKDGDYKREIPDMFANSVTCPRYCEVYQGQDGSTKDSMVLCNSCQKNQNNKVERLGAFKPVDERTFEWECSEYENYLNTKYKLCSSCRSALNCEIKRQDDWIKTLYSAELMKLQPESLRKLKGMNSNRCKRFWRIFKKLIPLFLVLLSIIPLHVEFDADMSIANKIVLTATAFIALTFNIISALLGRRISWLQMVSFVLWSNLFYISLSKRSVQMPLSLKLTMLNEVLSTICKLYQYLSRKWKEKRYLRERKSKIDRLTPLLPISKIDRLTPVGRRHLRDDCDSVITKSECLSGNVSTVSDDDFHASLDDDDDESVSTQPYEAPDLLQGDLHRMFIDRKENQNAASSQTITNHVVAALKYGSNKSDKDGPSSIKQPLIRPATFVYNKQTTKDILINNNNNNNNEHNNTITRQRTTHKTSQNYRDLDGKCESDESEIQNHANSSRDSSDKYQTRFRWPAVFASLFVVSVIFNGAFIFLYFKKKLI